MSGAHPVSLKRGVVALVGGLALLAGTTTAGGAPVALVPRAVLPQLATGEAPLAVDLAAAEARWAAQRPSRYRIGVSYHSFGAIDHVTVEVDGSAAAIVGAECEVHGAAPCPAFAADRYTVAGLFRTVAEALGGWLQRPPGEQGALVVAATFDPVDGHPLMVDTYVRLVTDTDVTWHVDWLEPLAE